MTIRTVRAAGAPVSELRAVQDRTSYVAPPRFVARRAQWREDVSGEPGWSAHCGRASGGDARPDAECRRCKPSQTRVDDRGQGEDRCEDPYRAGTIDRRL